MEVGAGPEEAKVRPRSVLGDAVVCSMCGDIGFPNALFLCKTCGHRHQHTYCSRFYPNIDMDKWSCEWCLHEEEQKSIKRRKVFEFLLDIAQSLPETSPAGGGNQTPIADRLPGPEEKRLPPGNPDHNHHHHGTGTRDNSNNRGAATKRSNNNKALDRWKSLAKNRFGCRRYKLLADVLC